MDGFEKRTIANTLQYHTPRPDWEHDQSWDWPFQKFGYDDPDVLFTDLHIKYNSIRCAIQDPQAWHLDVCEIAHLADNKKEFLDRLAKRQQERYEELEKAWNKTCAHLIGQPWRFTVQMDPDDLWERMISVSRNFAFDTFVDYFGAYARGERPQTPEPGSSPSESHQVAQRRAESEGRIIPAVDNAPQPELHDAVRPNSPPNEPSITMAPQPTREKSKPDAMPNRRTRSKAASTKKPAHATPTSRTTTRPNGIKKKQQKQQQPQRQQRSAEASNPTSLRRSARLRERAAREIK